MVKSRDEGQKPSISVSQFSILVIPIRMIVGGLKHEPQRIRLTEISA